METELFDFEISRGIGLFSVLELSSSASSSSSGSLGLSSSGSLDVLVLGDSSSFGSTKSLWSSTLILSS